MPERVTPMIHVPDVGATVDWYKSIGFTVDSTYGSDGPGLSFAILSFGTTQVMFNQGGRPSSEQRREVDLYTYTDDVDQLYEQLKDRVDIVEGLHDTFYGMREFIIRDLNRFWITFGQNSAFGALMDAIREGKIDEVQKSLDRGGISSESLTTALIAASSGGIGNPLITEMLKKAGAVSPPEVDEQILKSHTGHYKSEQGMVVEIVLKDKELFAVPNGADPIHLVAIDERTFRPLHADGVGIEFRVEEGKTVGFQLRQGGQTMELKRS